MACSNLHWRPSPSTMSPHPHAYTRLPISDCRQARSYLAVSRACMPEDSSSNRSHSCGACRDEGVMLFPMLARWHYRHTVSCYVRPIALLYPSVVCTRIDKEWFDRWSVWYLCIKAVTRLLYRLLRLVRDVSRVSRPVCSRIYPCSDQSIPQFPIGCLWSLC